MAWTRAPGMRAVGLAAALALGAASAAPAPLRHAQYDYLALELPADWESTMNETELWSLARPQDASPSRCSISVTPAGRGSGDLLRDLERSRRAMVPGHLVGEPPVVASLPGEWSVASARYARPGHGQAFVTLRLYARQGGQLQVVTLVHAHAACAAAANAVLESIRVSDHRVRVDVQGQAWPLPHAEPTPSNVALGR